MAPSKMTANPLMADILDQGENLVRVVNRLFGAERSAIEDAARFLGVDRPVALVGMASSAYLCMPAETYLLQHGRPASVISAADGAYFLLPYLKTASVVIVSRSGETAEIVRLAEALAEQGTRFVAVTNEPGSRLAKMAARVIWANTRKDALVSINVVTGLMAAVMALSAALVGELEAMRPEFERTATLMQGVVERGAQQAADLRGLFDGVHPIHLLYRGYDRGAAFCGRLVLEEVSRTPGVVLEGAEFRQGPNEVVDERFGAAVFAGEGKPGALNRSLAEDILHSGGRVLLIDSTGRPLSSPRALHFALPALHEALRPAAEIVPLQFLAYELAQAQGYTPGSMRYISKVILSEEGIPKQD